jgi:hypothetical protein
MTTIVKTVTALAFLATGSAFAGSPMISGGKGAPPPMAGASGCSSEISYNSLEVAYGHTFVSEPGFADANGVGVKLEYSPLNQFYLVGEGDYSRTSYLGQDINGWGVIAGVGGYLPISSSIHFATDLGGIWEGAKADGIKLSDGGFYVRPHFRFRANCAELHVGAKYVSLNDFGDRWEAFADLYYQVAPSLDVTVGAATLIEGDRDWALKAGLRLRF